MCVVIPFILDVRLVDAPAGYTQEEGRTGFLHLPSAVLAFIFIAKMIQPFLSLVDREVEFFFVYPRIDRSSHVWHDLFYFIFVRKNPSSCDCAAARDSNSRPNVRRFRGYQLNHRGEHTFLCVTGNISG